VPTSERGHFGSTSKVPGARADIVLVMRATDSGGVRVLGIPRDLVLYRHAHGPERLASILADGPGGVADALCNSLGIGVDHAVVLRLAGLESLVDLAGGIDVRSDALLEDHHSGMLIRPGVNHLNGAQALAYVRARHIYVLRDHALVPDPVRSSQRSQRAITVLTALSARVSLGWTSPIRSQRLLWTAAGAVTTDSGAGPGDLLDLLSDARKLGGGSPASLPIIQKVGDPVPIDAIGPGARQAISRFNGLGRQPKACSIPTLLSNPP
jgi:LCP family protein required for cell wall assembly